ncbi:hypothetical protein CcaverHIS002_0202200 [Cutaneotrichosporon cavernicola]|uniref:Uncharacterized protein n=1 Tax=Cutaneotrichosporon cavernicola TaxID=279322 RepID=A0AA48IDA2_9TREE|nr:uncharacterized protein CcaverHIS019_0202230 [Cutaneotrichosporon cavernicola]BEI81060.1 hypothetical protein CcaverHIS002_0202200 [Cutaneotrichosporon cavernicola]BEI88861.1 hypothetical protein CcaverHIS019_0202230 [Cutaneotrichosporon cavernicola]BEI96637.1 hypothetical protein CcaverHIS631_0202260 [Cutaneotrichosporon cavernicola]BEJ04410.1 hypothetical protein CcaverHIS641_0202270 [Cutaneotrichosporon cavernicola]
MSIRAAVARHVLQLTLRREFATTASLHDRPGSAHDWATKVLNLPRNDWDGSVVTPPLPSKPSKPTTSPKLTRKPGPKPTSVARDRPDWAHAVVDRPPPRSRREWGVARVTRRKAEPDLEDLGAPPSSDALEGVSRLSSPSEFSRLSGPTPGLEDAARRSSSHLERDGTAQARDGPTSTSYGLTLEGSAPSLLGDPRPGRTDAESHLYRVPKGKLMTRLGEEVKPWSRRDLRPNPHITVADILSCPPRWAPNRILAYLQTARPPFRVGAMHAHLERLRKLIDYIVPPKWGNLSAYRQRALLTLWSHWLQQAAMLNDLGALPRMRGWEGREFAAERFDALFLAILGGKVRPGKGEQWDKWKTRFQVTEMTPSELIDEEFARQSKVDAPPEPAYPPPRHTFGLKEREPEEPVKGKGPVTHYTPPTLYADSPVEKHVEYDQAYAKAMKMRGEALAAMRQKRARDALKAVSVAVAFMDTVEARPTEFQLQLILTHLMDHISFKEIMQYLSEEEQGPMHDVAARLQNLLQPWIMGPPIVEGPEVRRSAVTQWDSDNHLPARGQGRRMYAQRKQLLLTVGDLAMSRIEGGGERETYHRWLEAAETMLPEWHFMVERYEGLYREAAGGQPLRAPTIKEGQALHLLARYAISRIPRSGMSLPPGAEGTLADPLYCLRLLAGSDGVRYYPRQKKALHSIRAKDTDERIVSVAIRWARAAAQRSLLSPVVALLRILCGGRERGRTARPGRGGGPPPIPLRLGIYLAGSASAPEDIPALLPLLERVDVSPDAELAQAVDTAGWKMGAEQRVGRLSIERSGPHAVLVRTLLLSQEADGMGLMEEALPETMVPAPEGEETGFEARLRRMYQRWGLPVMGPRGETDGDLLRSRSMHPSDEVMMEERKTERARRRRGE